MSIADRIEYLAGRIATLKAEGDRTFAVLLALELRIQKNYKRRYDAILSHCHGNVLGLELGNGRGRFVAVLPEPAEGDKVRLLNFDEGGFSGHEVHSTQSDALCEALRQGYTIVSDGAMDRFAQQPKWHHGMRVADLIRQLGSGQIRMDHFHRAVAELPPCN